MRRFAAVLAFVAVVAACCSACSSTAPSATTAPTAAAAKSASATAAPTTSTTVPCDRPHAPGQTTETFTDQGARRTYELYVPKGYDGRTKVPVLLNFHGFGSNAKEQMIYGGLLPIAHPRKLLFGSP